MWKQARIKNPIWYFDATGSINKNVENQKKPMFYSLVFHDFTHKTIIPFADFVTTANDHNSISKYLSIIRSKLEESSNKNFLAKIIVTDMGWALINAVLLTFNNCNVLNYLNWAYDMIFNPHNPSLENVMKIKSYLCSTHFLKNIVKKVKSVTVFSNHVRKTFIFMFTLIQNSINIKQIDNYLKHIHNVFTNPYLDSSVYESLQFLAQEIKIRHLSTLNIDELPSPQQRERDESFEKLVQQTNIYLSVDYEENIKKNSPFKHYYDNLIYKFNDQIKDQTIQNSKTDIIKNEYYSPQLFWILEDKLYLLPLWSGMMIYSDIQTYKIKTRLTNNPVENWFGQIKNNILQKQKRLFASIIVTHLYNVLKSKYYQYYNENLIEDQKEENKEPNKLFETWSDKNLKKREREKGSFFKTKSFFKYWFF